MNKICTSNITIKTVTNGFIVDTCGNAYDSGYRNSNSGFYVFPTASDLATWIAQNLITIEQDKESKKGGSN